MRNCAENCTTVAALNRHCLSLSSENGQLRIDSCLLNCLRQKAGVNENIVYISPESASRQYFITIAETVKHDGKLQTAEWKCYSLDTTEKQIAIMHCRTEYDLTLKYLKGIRIAEIVVDKPFRNMGYGTQTLCLLKEYAKRLKAGYIHGKLSWVDIGQISDPEHQGKLERLARFYTKQGFILTDNSEVVIVLT